MCVCEKGEADDSSAMFFFLSSCLRQVAAERKSAFPGSPYQTQQEDGEKKFHSLSNCKLVKSHTTRHLLLQSICNSANPQSKVLEPGKKWLLSSASVCPKVHTRCDVPFSRLRAADERGPLIHFSLLTHTFEGRKKTCTCSDLYMCASVSQN